MSVEAAACLVRFFLVKCVEPLERILGGVELSPRHPDRPAPGRAIHRKNDPSVSVLVAEVHEDGVPVVLYAGAMIGIALLVEDPLSWLTWVRDEGSPAR